MSWFTPSVEILVEPWETVLVRGSGERATLLGPGRHKVSQKDRYVAVDLRERLDTLTGQEIPTADGLTVRFSALYRWRVVDALAWAEVSRDPDGELYAAVQMAVRDLVTPLGVAEVNAAARAAGAALLAAVAPTVTRLGIEVTAVEVRDVVLPATYREAQASLVLAEYRGQEKLAQARAETAALRALANAAKLMAENPALAQLRLVQELPMGSTVELRPGAAEQ